MTAALEVAPAGLDRSDRPEWLDRRRGGIGASESASLFGAGYDSALELYHAKVTGWEKPVTDQMLFGQIVESTVAREWAERTGHIIELAPTYRHPTAPHVLASPDYEIIDNKGIPLLEIKTVWSHWAARDWEHPDTRQLAAPKHVQIQVQHQLEVCGRPYAYVAALLGGRLDWLRIDRDPQAGAAIVRRCTEFWDRFIEPKIEPAAIPRDDLAAIYRPTDPDATVELDGHTLELLRERQKCKAEAGRQLDRAKTIDALVQQQLGKAEAGEHDGETVVTWREHDRRHTDNKAMSAAHPAIVAEFTTTGTARPFLVKDKELTP